MLLLLPSSIGPAQAQLRGHGGPVRALAISTDGAEAVSGSFDTSAIRWSLKRDVAEQVMRFHDSAVNAVVFLKDGRIATAGADAHIAIWTPGRPQPDTVLDGQPRRSWVSRCRPTARCLLRHHGIERSGSGRLPGARRVYSKDIRKTSTALRSCPTDAISSALATMRRCVSGRCAAGVR